MRGGQIGFKLRPVFFADPLKRSLIRPETRKCLRRHNEARLLLLLSSFLIVSEFISHTLSARQLVATFTASYKNLNKRVKKKRKQGSTVILSVNKKDELNATGGVCFIIDVKRTIAPENTWVYFTDQQWDFSNTENCEVTTPVVLWGYNVDIVWHGSLSSRSLISSGWEHNKTSSTDNKYCFF